MFCACMKVLKVVGSRLDLFGHPLMAHFGEVYIRLGVLYLFISTTRNYSVLLYLPIIKYHTNT